MADIKKAYRVYIMLDELISFPLLDTVDADIKADVAIKFEGKDHLFTYAEFIEKLELDG